MSIFSKVNKHTIAAFRQYLAMRGASHRSIKRKGSSLRKFFSWAVEKGYLKRSPYVKDTPLRLHFRAYRALPYFTYINFLILLIFGAALGFGIYQQFILKAPEKLAYPAAETRPKRYLSFQGRLTDSSNTPLVEIINFQFKLYDHVTLSTNLLWDSGSCPIDPDEDGIFNTILGLDCGSEIASSVFSENSQVWLQIQVGSETLSPRIQIATVAYALNAETLQGFPLASATNAEPTATMGATARTVPALNPAGNLVIASASPKIWSTSGTFQIRGQALSIVTDTGTGGNITIAPDGTGVLNIVPTSGNQIGGTINATNSALTTGALYTGRVENDNTGFDFLRFFAGTSPVKRFSVGALGNIDMENNLDVGGAATITGTLAANGAIISNLIPSGTRNLGSSGSNWDYLYVNNIDAFTLQGAVTGNGQNINDLATLQANTIEDNDDTTLSINDNLSVIGNVVPSAGNTYDLGASTAYWNNLYVNNIYAPGTGVSGYWQRNLGALSPTNITDDLLVGGTATSSAKFQVLGTGASAGTVNIVAGQGIDTLAAGTLTIGGTTQTGLTLGRSGAATSLVGSNMTAGGIGYGASNTLTFTAAGSSGQALLSGASGAPTWGTLGTTYGGTGQNWSAVTVGALPYFSGTGTMSTLAAGTSNYLLMANGAAAPSWTNAINGVSIGQTTAAAGSFTTLSSTGVTTLGNNTATVAINSSDWDIGTTGDMTGIGAITMDGNFSQTGATTFSTGTGLVSINGNLATSLIPNTTSYNLGSSSNYWGAVYANNYYAPGTGVSGYWQRNLGTLAPTNITDDVLVGGTATSSALVRLPGINNQNAWFNLGTGNVGIGDVSPLSLLTVGSGDKFQVGTSGNLTINTGTSATVITAERSANGYVIETNVGGTPGVDIGTEAGVGHAVIAFKNTDILMGKNSTSGIAFGSGVGWADVPAGATDINIKGNVGIGTTTPLATLDIAGSASASGNLTFRGTGTAHLINLYDNGSLQIGNSVGGGTATPAFVVTSAGQVGIGTTNPEALLHVAATGNLIVGNAASNRVSIGANSVQIFSGDSGNLALMVRAATSQSANIFQIQNSAATGLVTVDNSGNVGIGSTSPEAKLTINGTNTGKALAIFNETGTVNDIFTASSSGTPRFTISNAGNITTTGTASFNSGGVTIDSSNFVNAARFVDTAGSGAYFLDPAGAASLNIAGYATTAASLAVGYSTLPSGPGNAVFSGNVGIGTTSPAGKLHVYTDSTSADGVVLLQHSTNDTSTAALDLQFKNSGTQYAGIRVSNPSSNVTNMEFSNWSGSARTVRMGIYGTNGNVGIGTTDPGAKLHVYGTTYGTFRVGTAAQQGLDFSNASGDLYLGGDNTQAGNLYIKDSAAALKVAINSDASSYFMGGNVGIGDTTPTNTLDVTGAIGISDTAVITASRIIRANDGIEGTPAFTFSSDTNTGMFRATTDVLAFTTAGTEKVRIDSTGSVGIGTTGPGYMLEVEGSGTTASTEYLLGAFNQVTSAGGAYLGYYVGAGGAVQEGRVRSGGSIPLALGTTAYPQALYILNSNGNVGIGTTGPGSALHVYGGAPRIQIQGTTAGSNVGLQMRAVSANSTARVAGYYFVPGDTTATTFLGLSSDDSSYAMVVTNPGNVGIGNAAPALSLEVGDITLGVDAATGIGVQGDLEVEDFALLGALRVGSTGTDPGAGNLYTEGDLTVWGRDINFPAEGGGETYKIDAGTTNANTLTLFATVATLVRTGDIGGTIRGLIIDSLDNDEVAVDSLRIIRDSDGVADKEFRVTWAGAAYADGGWQGAADYAEYFYTEDTTIDRGDLVALTTKPSSVIPGGIEKATKANLNRLGGVVSTKPGFVGILGADTTDAAEEYENNPHYKLVGLLGQAPTKVSTENGPIEVGDLITSSNIPGVGMRATKAGPIVGRALEPYDNPDPSTVGKIMVFVNVSWYDPDVYLTDTGELQISTNTTNTTNKYQLTNKETIIDRIGTFAEIAVANLRAGLIQTQELFANYANINELKANISELANVKTGIISPLPDSSDVTIRLGRDVKDTPLQGGFGKLLIQNEQGETVASIDSEGKISADSLQINTDATISGTLYADEIITKHGKFGDLLAERITTTTVSAPSPTPTPELTGLNPVTPEASDSALLAEVQNWEITDPSQDLKITSNLKVLGRTSLADTTIAGQLMVDASIALSANGINSLTGPLYLNSLGLGPVDILAGKVVIDVDGNVQVAGNLAVGGNLSATTLHLGGVHSNTSEVTGTGSSDGESGFGKLLVALNKEGQEVASIDSSGKISADSLLISADYSATQSATLAEIRTNATSGLGILPAGQTEFTIFNPKVSENTLVYITPVSDTENKVLFVKAKKGGEWFKVGIDTPIDQEIRFNWWIIN